MVDVVAKVEHVQLGRQCRMRVVLSQECRPNVERSFDSVTSVYRAKVTRSTLSTFDNVDHVEFNFVPGFSDVPATARCQ